MDRLTSFFFVPAAALALLGIGWLMVSRLDRRGTLSRWEQAGASLALGFMVLHFTVMAVGRVRLDFTSMAAVAVLLSAIGALGLRNLPFAGLRADLKAEIAACRDPWTLVLWVSVLGLALTSLLQGMAPPNDYDSLMYHLALPRYDLERGIIAPAWDRGMPHVFFPELTVNLTRFTLGLGLEPAVQVMHGLTGIVAALFSAALLTRAGFGRRSALAAALLFLSNRAVLWEIASPEVDLPMAMFAAAALAAYLAWRRTPSWGGMILYGLLLGGGLNVKYHGFAVAVGLGIAMLVDLLRRKDLRNLRSLGQTALGNLIAVAAFAPLAVELSLLLGNPVFPLFNHVFNPESTNPFFVGAELLYGTGRGLGDLLTTPWTMFIQPMAHFDGMIMGAPLILALAPLALMATARRRLAVLAWPVLCLTGLYYVIWFYLMSQQVRFLLPIMPILAALSGAGAVALAEQLRRRRWTMVLGLALATVAYVNQAMFAAVYVGARLPPALGLRSPAAYLDHTPTMDGAFYQACRYITDNLPAGGRYLSLLAPHSYYCPQASATLRYFPDEAKDWLLLLDEKPMSPQDFVQHFADMNYRFVIALTIVENRRNDSGKAMTEAADQSWSRNGRMLAAPLSTLTPEYHDHRTAVYDGAQVLDSLRRYYGLPCCTGENGQ